ncbi:hypothetical protein, partial [Deinococcus xianganensis]|uniref:hypothetical protein n=1 Tax=Deinococcus xianganensis TaxID=1507289 RepID=UPI001F197C95
GINKLPEPQEVRRVGTPHEELIHALDNLRHLIAKDQLAKLTPEARGVLLSLLKQAAAVTGERTNAPSRKRLR